MSTADKIRNIFKQEKILRNEIKNKQKELYEKNYVPMCTQSLERIIHTITSDNKDYQSFYGNNDTDFKNAYTLGDFSRCKNFNNFVEEMNKNNIHIEIDNKLDRLIENYKVALRGNEEHPIISIDFRPPVRYNDYPGGI